MDLNIFSDSNINVHFWDYSGYPVYNQLNPPFEHSVSILDLLFNEGKIVRIILNLECYGKISMLSYNYKAENISSKLFIY